MLIFFYVIDSVAADDSGKGLSILFRGRIVSP